MGQRLLVLAAICLSAGAHASYDLVFVADAGNNAIHRFDGSSGAYLGSIGAGVVTGPRSIVVDQTNSRLFVVADNGLFQFELWSGVLRNTVQTFPGGQACLYAPGQYLFGFSYATTLLGGCLTNSDGWYVGMSMGASATYRAAGMRGSTLCTVGSTGYREYSTNGYFGAATLTRTVTLTSPGTLGQISAGSDYTLVADVSSNRYHLVSNVSNYAGANTVGALSTLTGIQYAHGSTYYACGRNAANTGGLLVMGSSNNQAFNMSMGAGYLNTPTSVAVIAAPEPGAWAAMGLGLGALILRRRKQR